MTTHTLITALASLLGIPLGFLLAKIAQEELKEGEYYFKWMQNILLIIIINIFFSYQGRGFLTLLGIFVITAGLVLKYKPGHIVGFALTLFLMYLSKDIPQLVFILSSLLFLYGLPTAALIKYEGIKTLRYPIRHIIKKTYIIGHRGAPKYEPENTLLSFQKAILLGADMIEIDARITKDKKIVIIHDATVDRTTNGKGTINRMLLKNIKKLKTVKNQKIPTLEEVIDLAKKKIPININIKEHAATDMVVEIVKRKRFEKHVLISSPSENTLQRVKELAPKIKTAYILARLTPFYLDIAKRLDIEAIHPMYSILTKRLVLRAHRHNLKVNVWTIKKKYQGFKAKLYYNVDGLITDDPFLYSKK